MPQRHSFIATLGGSIYFERLNPASSEKVNSFGETLALLASGLGGSVSLHALRDRMILNGGSVPIAAPGASEVSDSLLEHQVQAIRFPTDPAAQDFQTFAGVFARDRGTYENIAGVRTALGLRFSAEGQVEPVGSRPPLLRQTSEPDWHSTAGPLSDPHESMTGGNGKLAAPVVAGAREATYRDYESRAVEAERENDAGALLDVALDVAEAEAHSHTEVGGIELRALLRRILTPSRLILLAGQVGNGARPEEATGVLRRVGQGATDALMRRLVEAGSQSERRGYFRALTHMTEGTDTIVRHIGHELWYVVRNAADLAGDMDLELAVPALAKQADHSDERARRSVARALAMICTQEAHQPLGLLISDPSLQVRLGAITHLNPRRSRQLGWPLARQLVHEPSLEIQQAIVKILGDLGTSAALRGLEAFVAARPDSPAAVSARERLARPDGRFNAG
ncbi:MAG: HEAT repeat domain-containing protein [Gemmatimonadota bacterium]